MGHSLTLALEAKMWFMVALAFLQRVLPTWWCLCSPGSPGNTHVCSTRTLEFSKLKDRTAPLLKPQKKLGIVG